MGDGEPLARVRCFFSRQGLTRNEEVVSRTVTVITTPSDEIYRFPGDGNTRVSPWQEIHNREDVEWFEEHSPFHVEGVQ